MKKILFAFASLLIAAGVQAQKTHPDISSLLVKATIDPSVIKGPVKPMNAVNNGPNPEDDPQQMEDFRILNIPFCRTHDSTVDDYYGYHLVDISEVFPDFSKDPDKESSYDFRETDAFIKTLLDSGAKVMYRLGQSIETHTAAKYNIYPPKDYRKWARICEHVIMHYNEGWAKGFHYDIRYSPGRVLQVLRSCGKTSEKAFPGPEDRRPLILQDPARQDVSVFPGVLQIHACPQCPYRLHLLA